MKTHTTKKALWLRSLILLPLLAVLIYSFSERKVVEKPQIYQIANDEIKVHISKDKKATIGNETIDFNSLSDKLIEMTRDKVIKPSINIEIDGHLDSAYLEDITNEVKKSKLDISQIGATAIFLDENGKMGNDYFKGILTAKTIHLKNRNGELVKGTTGQQIIRDTLKASSSNEDYDLITIKLPKDRGRNLNSNDLEKLDDFVKETFYEQNKQQKATSKEIEEYNKLANQYNSIPENSRAVKLKDFERLEYIYNKMTKEQKASAQAFPNFPPPPPPSPVMEPKNPSKELLQAKKEFEEKGNAYGEAMGPYLKEGKGDMDNLKVQYEEVMKLYNAYRKLAENENTSTPPSPVEKSVNDKNYFLLELKFYELHSELIFNLEQEGEIVRTKDLKNAKIVEDYFILTLKVKELYNKRMSNLRKLGEIKTIYRVVNGEKELVKKF